jgi:uncharacterized protein (TIGR02271 family)
MNDAAQHVAGISPLPVAAVDGITDSITVALQREELRVGKRVVDAGRGVRLHKRVITQPQQVQLALWRDQLDVRHVPVDRVVDIAPPARYEGDTLVVPVLEEILVKRYRITEELHITCTKQAVTHTDSVPLRTEQIDVEWFDDNTPS